MTEYTENVKHAKDVKQELQSSQSWAFILFFGVYGLQSQRDTVNAWCSKPSTKVEIHHMHNMQFYTSLVVERCPKRFKMNPRPTQPFVAKREEAVANIRSNRIQSHTGTSQSILSQSKNRILKISKMNVLRQDRFPGFVMPLFPSALFTAFLPRLRGSCGCWWGESLDHCDQFVTDNRKMNVLNSKAVRLFPTSTRVHSIALLILVISFVSMAFLNCDGFIVCQLGAFASNRNSPCSWVARLGFPCGRLRSEENWSQTSKVKRKSDEKYWTVMKREKQNLQDLYCNSF